MRQGLFPICIVCVVTVAASRKKKIDKPSIATKKSFCNSNGFQSRRKRHRGAFPLCSLANYSADVI